MTIICVYIITTVVCGFGHVLCMHILQIKIHYSASRPNISYCRELFQHGDDIDKDDAVHQMYSYLLTMIQNDSEIVLLAGSLMPSKNGNSSGWWVSIRRNANCYESPEINLKRRRPTWYMDTHLLKLTLRNTLVYPSIHTHLGPHTPIPQPRRPMELEPSSSATYARRQLQWTRAHTNPRIPHPPNPWILRCGMGPPHSPRRKQARDGPTPVCPLHIPGLWSNQQRHCHAENSERRAKARITMIYMIVHGLVEILASDHIIQAPASRRTGNAQFRVPYARTLAYQRGFFLDGTRLWNALPNEVKEAERIETFKERLSQLRIRCWDHSSTL